MQLTVAELVLLLKTKGAEQTKKELSGVASALKGIGVTLSVAFILRGLQQLAKGAFNFGMEMSAVEAQTNRAYNALFNLLGPQALGLMDDLRSVTQGAISDMQLLATANQFVSMGLASTAAGITDIAHVVTQLELMTNRHASLSAAMQDFAMLIANQSVRRFDQFGLSVDHVRARMDELRQTMPGVATQTLFLTATMEEAQSVLDKLGDQTVSAGEKMDATWKNVTRSFQTWLATTIAGKVWIDYWTQGIDEMTRATQKYNDSLQISLALNEFDNAMSAIGDSSLFASSAVEAGAAQLQSLRDRVAAGTLGIDELREAIIALGQYMYRVTNDESFKKFFNVGQITADLAGTGEEFIAAQEKYKLSLMDTGQKLDHYLVILQQYPQETLEWYETMLKIGPIADQLTQGSASLADAQFEYNLLLVDSETQLQMLRERLNEINAESEEGIVLQTRILQSRQAINAEDERNKQAWLESSLARRMFQMTDVEQLRYWQNEMRLAGYGNKRFEDAYLEALRLEASASEQYGNQITKNLGDIRSAVESLLQPTEVTGIDWDQTRLGTYSDKWDEYVRRLRSAATDSNSAWKSMIPIEIMQKGADAVKAWMAETERAFYAGRMPEQINWAGFDEAYAAYMAGKADRELLIQTAMARVGGGRADVMQALGITSDMLGSSAALAESMAASAGGIADLTDNMPSLNDAILLATQYLQDWGVALWATMGLGPPLPGYQHGTNYTPGGLSWVGENGKELLRLPTGSQVYTQSQAATIMGGISINVTVQSGGNAYMQGMEAGRGILQELRARGIA